jgi:hypothetical protein
MNPKPVTWRSEKYLKWLSERPCVICCKPSGPPHHESMTGRKGWAKKPSDLEALPLCPRCHALRHSTAYRADTFWLWCDPTAEMLRNINDWLVERGVK